MRKTVLVNAAIGKVQGKCEHWYFARWTWFTPPAIKKDNERRRLNLEQDVTSVPDLARNPNFRPPASYSGLCLFQHPDDLLFNLMDGYTREALRIEPDTSRPGLRVVRVLDALRERRGTPTAIQVDNGTEFTSRVVDQWAYQNQVALHFIERGKPTQNALIESFNGKFRDECLNQNWFVDLRHAREVIEAWRVDYNTVRPHSSLRTPRCW